MGKKAQVATTCSIMAFPTIWEVTHGADHMLGGRENSNVSITLGEEDSYTKVPSSKGEEDGNREDSNNHK